MCRLSDGEPREQREQMGTGPVLCWEGGAGLGTLLGSAPWDRDRMGFGHRD